METDFEIIELLLCMIYPTLILCYPECTSSDSYSTVF
jgi:hypothetical protein